MKRIFISLIVCLMMALNANAGVDYLCFTAQEANSTVTFSSELSSGKKLFTTLETSTNGKDWKAYKLDTAIKLAKVGDKVYFRGDYKGVSGAFDVFKMTGKIAASGNIMTLTDGANPTTSLTGKELVFWGLFAFCESLTKAPSLPAKRLAKGCYSNMFQGCTSLTEAPALPSTNIEEDCYYSMFSGCTALKKAPALSAKITSQGCYSYMFADCTSLTEAPYLPTSKDLAQRCYSYMFKGCKKLNKVQVAFTEWGTTFSLYWLKDVASSGTFICPKELKVQTGDSYIPKGWKVSHETSGIEGVTLNQTKLSNKKYVKDGQLIIENANSKYNAAGVLAK